MSQVIAHLSTAGIPIGTIIAFAGEKNRIPRGWLPCEGQTVSKQTYPKLSDVIGTVWGGSGTPDFFLPDLRGMFLRGVSGDSDIDPDKTSRTSPQPIQSPNNPGNQGNDVGSVQEDKVGHIPECSLTFQRGNVRFDNSGGTEPVMRAGNIFDGNFESKKSDNPISNGHETRPKNVYVFYIIKVDD